MQLMFGAGSLWGIRTDASGLFTAQKFAVLQGIQFDFTKNLKELFGSYQMAIAIGAGTMKTTAKAQQARINAQRCADLYFGLTPTTGQNLIAEDEAGTVPTTPFAVTVTNSATWAHDLGVYYSLTGLPLTRVAAEETPTTGQYKVTAGVYTFAAADTGLAVLINYVYTAVTGKTLTLTNQLLGITPTFQGWFKGLYNGKQMTLKLTNCVSSKLSIPLKMEDWTISEFDFQMSVDASNTLGVLTTAE